MKNRFIKTLCACAVICAVFCVFAYAQGGLTPILSGDETTAATQHDHRYKVTEFNDGVVTLSCELCGNSYTVNFSEHINDTNCSELDVVEDGIVNAKDYAYLMKNYGSTNSSGAPWEGEEIEIP